MDQSIIGVRPGNVCAGCRLGIKCNGFYFLAFSVGYESETVAMVSYSIYNILQSQSMADSLALSQIMNGSLMSRFASAVNSFHTAWILSNEWENIEHFSHFLGDCVDGWVVSDWVGKVGEVGDPLGDRQCFCRIIFWRQKHHPTPCHLLYPYGPWALGLCGTYINAELLACFHCCCCSLFT